MNKFIFNFILISSVCVGGDSHQPVELNSSVLNEESGMLRRNANLTLGGTLSDGSDFLMPTREGTASLGSSSVGDNQLGNNFGQSSGELGAIHSSSSSF